jgi:hypothetical protein
MTIHQKIGTIIILVVFLAVIGLLGSKEIEAYQPVSYEIGE